MSYGKIHLTSFSVFYESLQIDSLIFLLFDYYFIFQLYVI